MTEEVFTERIKKIIEIAGNADKLARMSGMSPRVIGKYLAGDSDPSREKLVALANATNVNISWLANGEGPMIKERSKTNTNFGTQGIGTVSGVSGGNVTGIMGGNFPTPYFSEEVERVCDLLRRYHTPPILMELKDKLLKIKSAMGE